MPLCPKRRFVALAAAAVSASLIATAALAQNGKATVDTLTKMFVAWSGKLSDNSVYERAAKYIDYDGMAERALTKPEWDKLKPGERSALSNTIRDLIQHRYYPRWHKIFGKGKLEYLSESESNGDTLVTTVLTVGKQKDDLIWRLDNRGGEHKVISLAVGEKDLLERLGERLQSRYHKSGYKGLMAWLTRKADADDFEEGKPSGDATAAL